ncbi:hypothetical protein VNO78_19784 [Psophocarpus tetragonolobus]|uniref:Uncharacterized protein n=1 Tax=Psophocarpus tetragonolobus TaxID=3891 RepID=A0AAN9SC43_PSOTE
MNYSRVGSIDNGGNGHVNSENPNDTDEPLKQLLIGLGLDDEIHNNGDVGDVAMGEAHDSIGSNVSSPSMKCPKSKLKWIGLPSEGIEPHSCLGKDVVQFGWEFEPIYVDQGKKVVAGREFLPFHKVIWGMNEKRLLRVRPSHSCQFPCPHSRGICRGWLWMSIAPLLVWCHGDTNSGGGNGGVRVEKSDRWRSVGGD